MKRFIGILISIAVVMTMGCAANTPIPCYIPNANAKLVGFKPGLEPAGVNGIKWETELSTLNEMKLYVRESDVSFYSRPGDEYKLKSGKLIPIHYGFRKDKFYVGVVRTKEIPDWEALKETVFEKYGVGAKPFSNKDEYIWIGKDVTMALRYDEESKKGLYYIRSHTMEKQMP
jgi:hypothetical protein